MSCTVRPSFQHLGHGKDGADAHLVRLAARHGKAQEAAQGLQTLAGGEVFADHHAGARAIAELAGVAGGDQAAGEGASGR